MANGDAAQVFPTRAAARPSPLWTAGATTDFDWGLRRSIDVFDGYIDEYGEFGSG
jgi:hypothetical protein